MNVSIKSKFSVIIIFMSVLSLIFAYIISSEIVYSNLREQYTNHIEEKKDYIKLSLTDLKLSFKREGHLIAQNLELGEILEEIKNSKEADKNYFREFNDFFEYTKLRINDFATVDICIVDSELNELFRTNYQITEDKKLLKESMGITSEHVEDISMFYLDDDGNYYLKAYSPVTKGRSRELLGAVAISYKLGLGRLYGLKKTYNADIVLQDSKNNYVMSTLNSKLDKLNYRKDGYLEIDNKLYISREIDMKDLGSDGKMIFAFATNKLLSDISEVTGYLFMALFFIFAVLFLISTTILNVLVDSIKQLTLKINSLKDGNLNISLGKLKNSGDEIGILAQDFETMMIKLKDKIKELEEADRNNRNSSQRLELMNKDLKEAQKKMKEKNQNIDRINKLLNSRISEITNMYYLMVNISKYIIDDNFYDIILKGVREGLILQKAGIYLYNEDNKKLEYKKGVGIGETPQDLPIEEYVQYLSKRDILQANEVYDFSYYTEFREPYFLPLVGNKNNDSQFYGVMLVDNGVKLTQEMRKSLLTYVKAILLAIENRKLYIQLIEENKKMEITTKELQESERMKNIFISNVSHELKIPLVPIKGYTELLLDAKIGDISVKQRKALKTSISNVERLQEIIENILNYSRIESGKYQMLNEKIFIEDVLDEALARMENIIETERVIIRKNFSTKGAEIYGDRDAVKQIFINLISNAIKFSKNSLIIDIKIGEEKEKYKISIKDNGVGMDKEKLEHVLQSFRQLEEGNTRKYRGLGLGLTVVDKILSYYDEKIYLLSKENEGTEVYFYIEKLKK